MNRATLGRTVIIACLALAAACGPSGSGTIITEQRSVGPFDTIDVSEGVSVLITVDPAADHSVSVVYDDNLVDKVITRVSGNTLVLELEGSVRLFGGGRFVEVTMPDLLAVDASGGADVEASGVAEGVVVDASGGADVDLQDLLVAVAEVDASGGADVTVTASDAVTGKASGGSNVIVHGGASDVDVETSGGADLDIVR